MMVFQLLNPLVDVQGNLELIANPDKPTALNNLIDWKMNLRYEDSLVFSRALSICTIWVSRITRHVHENLVIFGAKTKTQIFR